MAYKINKDWVQWIGAVARGIIPLSTLQDGALCFCRLLRLCFLANKFKILSWMLFCLKVWKSCHAPPPHTHILFGPFLRICVTLVEQVLLTLPVHISYHTRFSAVFVLLGLLFSLSTLVCCFCYSFVLPNPMYGLSFDSLNFTTLFVSLI